MTKSKIQYFERWSVWPSSLRSSLRRRPRLRRKQGQAVLVGWSAMDPAARSPGRLVRIVNGETGAAVEVVTDEQGLTTPPLSPPGRTAWKRRWTASRPTVRQIVLEPLARRRRWT